MRSSRFQGTCKVHSITQVLHFHVKGWMWVFIHFSGDGHISKVNLVIFHWIDRCPSIHPSIQSHDQGHGIKVHWTLIMAFMTRVCKGNSRISSHPNTWQARNSSDLGYTYRISPIYALIYFTLISISLHQCWVGRRVLLNRFPPI